MCRKTGQGKGCGPDAWKRRILLGTLLLAGANAQAQAASLQAHAESRPELMLQLAHRNLVRSVAYSRDGAIFVSGSWDTTVKIWDGKRHDLIRTLTGHHYPINAVVISPDGKQIASGAGLPENHAFPETPGEVCFWDTATGALQQTVPQTHPVLSVAFSPDGKTLAFASVDTAVRYSATGPLPQPAFVRFWDIPGHTLLHRSLSLSGVGPIAYSPDGRLLAIGRTLSTQQKASRLPGRNSHPTLLQPYDAVISLYNARTYSPVKTLRATNAEMTALAFSPDGKLLASAGMSILSTQLAGEIRLWDPHTDSLLRTLSMNSPPLGQVALSPDGETLAVGSNRGIDLWDVKSGKVRRQVDTEAGPPNDMAFSPDNRYLAAAGGETHVSSSGWVEILDLQTFRPLWERDTSGYANGAVAFAPDGRLLAVGSSDDKVRLWDAQTGQITRTFTGADVDLNLFPFFDGGRSLATIGETGSVVAWDAASGRRLGDLTPGSASIQAFALDTAGKRLVTLDARTAFQLWDVTTKRLLLTLIILNARGENGAEGSAEWIAYTPDGYYTGSANIEAYIRWRTGQVLLPGERFAATYRRPDLVRQAASK